MRKNKEDRKKEVQKKRAKAYLDTLEELFKTYKNRFLNEMDLTDEDMELNYSIQYIWYPGFKSKFPEYFIILAAETDNLKPIKQFLKNIPFYKLEPEDIKNILYEAFKLGNFEFNIFIILIHIKYHLWYSIEMDYFYRAWRLNPFLLNLYAKLYQNRSDFLRDFYKEYKQIRLDIK